MRDIETSLGSLLQFCSKGCKSSNIWGCYNAGGKTRLLKTSSIRHPVVTCCSECLHAEVQEPQAAVAVAAVAVAVVAVPAVAIAAVAVAATWALGK